MPEQPNRLSEHTPPRFVFPWIRARWGRLLLLFILLFLGLVFLIKPLSYTITHFQENDCGSLNGVSVIDEAAAKQDTQCFLRAHQSCEAATLEVLYQGVDSGGQVTFRTANRIGNCTLSVIGYPTHCIVLFCNMVPYIDNDCRAVTQQSDGLHLEHCGTWPQDFVLCCKHF